MLETTLHYVRRAPRIARALATEPVETLRNVREVLVYRRERGKGSHTYVVQDDWEQELHRRLGAPWPCPLHAEFHALWSEVSAALIARTGTAGPASFGCWNDGDCEMVRATWCLTRHLQPQAVVETGVARGVTTRFVLEALERNAAGHLWSIDRPPALQKELHTLVAAAVVDRLRHRWTYLRGSSRRWLPGLAARLGAIDLFIHDSLHTEDNVTFELACVWPVLKPAGAIVVDDIDLNRGFHAFTDAVSPEWSSICRSNPTRLDSTRYNGTGLFGIIRKPR